MDKLLKTKVIPCYRAIEEGRLVDVQQALRETPALIDAIADVFGTVLHVAAEFGQLELVKYFVSCGLDCNARSGTYGGNALNEAACNGHLDVVEYLYSIGAELDVSEPERNPLFGAILGGYIDVVKFLLKAGIDFRIKYTGQNMTNMDAIAFAKERGQTEIVRLLESLEASGSGA